MMNLQHFGVEIGQNLGDLGDNFHQHVDPDAHVGRDHGSRAWRDFARPRFHLGREAGGAEHNRGAGLCGYFKMLERGACDSEIEGYGAGLGDRRVIRSDRHAERPHAGERARVGADGRGLTRLQRADQAMRAILCDERGEQTAHPARCASHNQVGHRASPYPSATARASRLCGAD